MKIVINKCFGGFGLSPTALLWLYERGCKSIAHPVEKWFGKRMSYRDKTKTHLDEELEKWQAYQKDPKGGNLFLTTFSPDEQFILTCMDIERTNPLLVECVETLGIQANGSCAKLRVVDIPDGTDYTIDDYDGQETVEERHQSWG